MLKWLGTGYGGGEEERSVIPIGDSVPSRTFPLVNLLIISANVAVFFYELSLGGRINAFFYDWGVVPAFLSDYVEHPGDNSSQVLLTPFTAMFMHGGWVHLIGNMVFLWVFGDNIEDALGHLRYLVFYVLAGLGAVALQVFFSPNDLVPMVGASGAIAGVLAAYMVLYPRATVVVLIPLFLFFWTAYVPAIFLIGMWFIIQLMSGLATVGYVTGGSGGVAWWAHVGGFLAGIVLVSLLLPPAHRLGSK